MPGGCGLEVAATESTEDGAIDVPVLSLDAIADGLESSGELLGHDHRPMPAAAAQHMYVHAVLIRQCQERQGTAEASHDEPPGARGAQDVVAYVMVEAVGAQLPLPDYRFLRGLRSGRASTRSALPSGASWWPSPQLVMTVRIRAAVGWVRKAVRGRSQVSSPRPRQGEVGRSGLLLVASSRPLISEPSTRLGIGNWASGPWRQLLRSAVCRRGTRLAERCRFRIGLATCTALTSDFRSCPTRCPQGFVALP